MILILGYYDKFNLGDQAYQLAFPILLKKNNIYEQILFKNPYNLTEIPPGISVVICGGGDIVNDWFNGEFERLFQNYSGKIYAISIGITYPSTITAKYLARYSQVFLRHRAYSREMQLLKHTENVYHIPDITFLIQPEIPLQASKTMGGLPKIGVFTANGIDIKEQLKPILHELTSQYEIIFYSFNTSPLSHESDILDIKHNYPEFKHAPLISDAKEMLRAMASLSFAICVRYHSHIFSIIQHIPFVSIASTPKVQFLMEDNNLTSVAFNPKQPKNDLRTLIHTHLQEPAYSNLKAQLSKIHTDSAKVLDNLKIMNNVEKTLDQIHSECKELITNNASPDLIASHVLYNITKSVNNRYSYGFIENLKNATHNIFDMIKWVYNDFRNIHPKGIKFVQSHDEFHGVHRSGWDYVASNLRQLETPTGISCDLYVDGTFHWNEHLYAAQGIIPYKRDWIGFVHHTQHATYNDYNLQNLFKKESFLLSLKFCKALVTMSEYTLKYIQFKLDELGFHSTKTFKLIHPSEFSQHNFRHFNFAANPRIVQIGAWLRDPYGIYQAPFNFGSKFVLIGKNMEDRIHPESVLIKFGPNCTAGCDKHEQSRHRSASLTCDCLSPSQQQPQHHHMCRPTESKNTCVQFILKYIWELQAPPSLTILTNHRGCNCNSQSPIFQLQSFQVKRSESRIRQLNAIIKRNQSQVEFLKELSNDAYDKLLSNSIVFLKLEDASAVNTIIECIIRNTPIVVNRLPATEEYLGVDYPLFYEKMQDITKITINDVKRAHVYLTKLDKRPFMIETFIRGVKDILAQI